MKLNTGLISEYCITGTCPDLPQCDHKRKDAFITGKPMYNIIMEVYS